MEHNLLDVENVDFVTLKAVVSFIYTGEIDLTTENVKKLLPASVWSETHCARTDWYLQGFSDGSGERRPT